MYERFFGLRERPFELGSDLRFLFLPAPHQEALSNLRYGIATRKGVTVLTGEVGTGKTTLVRAAIAHADPTSVCLHVTNPRLTRAEFFQFLADGFKLEGRAGGSKVSCLVALEQRLITRLNRGEFSTLIIDEVQSVSGDVLEEIRLLTNMELAGGVRLLSIVLVGQPEFGLRLNEPELRHLKQRVALRCELRPLTLHETAGFIASRLRVAGGAAATVFTREAVQLIHEVSSGIPRVISVLCDNALLTGFAAGERPVGTKILQEVCRDFQIGSPATERADVMSSAEGSDGPHHSVIERAGLVAVPVVAVEAPVVSVAEEPNARPMFSGAVRRRRFGFF